MIEVPALQEFAKRWDGAAMQPLRIKAYTGESVAHYAGLHFDAILSHAVVEQATQGEMLPASAEAYSIPLPLMPLWRSPSGRVLWATTDLEPSSNVRRSEIYYHRRSITPRMSTAAVQSGKGRHKEKRTPIPVSFAESYACDVVGHADTIAELLRNVTSIGKKRTSIGRVIKWTIAQIDEFHLTHEGKARRPIPIDYLYPDGIPISAGFAHIAFSPPYWLTQGRTACIPTGGAV